MMMRTNPKSRPIHSYFSRFWVFVVAFQAIALLFLSKGPSFADSLDDALDAEIARSTTSLRQDEHPAPYFVSLRVDDASGAELRCMLGGVQQRSLYRDRRLVADLRVGSPELDGRPEGAPEGLRGRELPYSADAPALRRVLWSELDAAYKSAVAGFLRKKAARVKRGKAEYESDDLSREESGVFEEPEPAESWPEEDLRRAESLCRSASAVFRSASSWAPRSSGAGYYQLQLSRRLRDSQGTRMRHSSRLAQLTLQASDLAPDGAPLSVSRVLLARGPGSLPDRMRVEEEARAMIADLKALQAAPSTSPFAAPAIVDPSVAAALLEALAMRLSGEEQRDPDGAQTFRGKVGRPILPAFLTLIDDPAREEHGGRALLGHYRFDAEGVRAQKTVLVREGKLESFLLSRYPLPGLPNSNGHARAASGYLPMGRASNLILTSSRALGREALLARLRELCIRNGKSQGLLIERAQSWSQQGGTNSRQSLRLVPTRVTLVDAASGARTLVRDLDMVGTPLDLAGKIVATGDDTSVTDNLVEQESGRIPVSVVAPSLLLEEVELQRSRAKPQKAPVLPPP